MDLHVNGRHVGRATIFSARMASYRMQLLRRDLGGQRKPATYGKFVISSSGRSGSTMLLHRCHSHPEISCFGEMLHVDRIYWHRRFMDPDHPGCLAERKRAPGSFLDRHVWYHHNAAIKAVGFKLLHDQLVAHRESLHSLLAETATLKVLRLRRHNSFDVFLSNRNFERTGVGSLRPGEIRPTQAPMMVDVEECRRFLTRVDLLESISKAVFAKHRTLELSYEQLVADSETENRKICDFLDVQDLPLSQSLKKLNPGRLSEKVSNLEEVQRHFKGTKWEPFFQDD